MQLVKSRDTDPLLPALVESLGLVHAVPVAKVSAVPVVAKVTVLVAEIATVTASLLELWRERRWTNINILNVH